MEFIITILLACVIYYLVKINNFLKAKDTENFHYDPMYPVYKKGEIILKKSDFMVELERYQEAERLLTDYIQQNDDKLDLDEKHTNLPQELKDLMRDKIEKQTALEQTRLSIQEMIEDNAAILSGKTTFEDLASRDAKQLTFYNLSKARKNIGQTYEEWLRS